MSKKTINFPNVINITKGIIKRFWIAAKVFKIDGALTILTLFVILYWIFNNDIWVEGAIVVLFVYAFRTTIILSDLKSYINYLKKLLKDNNIQHDN